MNLTRVQLMAVLEKRVMPNLLLAIALFQFEQLRPHAMLVFYALNEPTVFSLFFSYRKLLRATVRYPVHHFKLLVFNTVFSFIAINILLIVLYPGQWLAGNIALAFAVSIGIAISNTRFSHREFLGIPLLRLSLSWPCFLGVFQLLSLVRTNDTVLILLLAVLLLLWPWIAWKNRAPRLVAEYI